MRVISLSTIPPRFAGIGATLASLLDQSVRADQIQLCIPKTYRRFPDYDGSVPSVPEGIRIVRPDTDLGPASKVLHAVKEHQGRNTQILFCDDDLLYGPEWAKGLFDVQEKRPGECVALIGKDIRDRAHRNRQPRVVRRRLHRGFGMRLRRLKSSLYKRLRLINRQPTMLRPIEKAGYADLFQGWGGVVVRPTFFDDVAYDIPSVIWAVDDVWLSGMLERKGIPIWVPSNLEAPSGSGTSRVEALKGSVIDGARRGEANRAAIRALRESFGIWA